MTQGQAISIPPRVVPRTTTFCITPPTVVVFPSDATTTDQMNIVEMSGTLSFWNDDAENLYEGE